MTALAYFINHMVIIVINLNTGCIGGGDHNSASFIKILVRIRQLTTIKMRDPFPIASGENSKSP